jgi:hypothetical protein
MTDEPLGRQISRAKPVRLAFYDMLGDVPFTRTFRRSYLDLQ